MKSKKAALFIMMLVAFMILAPVVGCAGQDSDIVDDIAVPEDSDSDGETGESEHGDDHEDGDEHEEDSEEEHEEDDDGEHTMDNGELMQDDEMDDDEEMDHEM